MSKEKKVREPWIHITKRDAMPWQKALIIRIVAVVVALFVCSLVTVLMTDLTPITMFRAMIRGVFGSKIDLAGILVLLQNTAILLCISLAVTPAFKMRFWNIGAEGQVLMGGLAAAACMICLRGKVPNGVLILLIFLAGIVSGMIWGVVPAIFKAKWGTNETLFTLMMNYIAMQIVFYFVVLWENPKGGGKIGIINGFLSGHSKAGWLPDLFGQKYVLNILIVIAVTVLMYVYLKYSKQGFEISVVGESENTARYVGINVKKVIIRTMAVSGAICGLAGVLLVSGTHHTIAADTVGGQGFTAVMVSWLSKFNPFVMAGVSLMIAFLEKGAGGLSTATNAKLNTSFADVLIGIILFFIIGCEFFIGYQIHFAGKREKKQLTEGGQADAR